ncbi:hypothetical protein LPJ56_001461, partial [Coemansia sp. RSA 2599]
MLPGNSGQEESQSLASISTESPRLQQHHHQQQQRPTTRRRSASDLKKPTPADDSEPTAASANADTWLNDELEAVGELKRGVIAARFPEEFSVDSDFLVGASNVWLPARLHPEIAPGEFQEWLKKHGSQLSKMEDTVNRRKSILSYSYKNNNNNSGSTEGLESEQLLSQQQGSRDGLDVDADSVFAGSAMRRRNTTGLVRRKTFIERVDEEERENGGESPYLVQSIQRSSLKRSKLANKRRDSTASNSPAGRRRRGTGTRMLHEATAPSVSSPLAPATADAESDSGSKNSSGEAGADATAAGAGAGAAIDDDDDDDDDEEDATAAQQSLDEVLKAPVPAARPESTLLPNNDHARLYDQYVPSTDHYHHQQQQQQTHLPVAPAGTATQPPQPPPNAPIGGASPAAIPHPDPNAKRLSTAEILKQVTAAVDDFGFDDFELCDDDVPKDPAGAYKGHVQNPPKTTSAPFPPRMPVPAQQQQQQQQDSAQADSPSGRKTITHKKSSSSWWQWATRDDSSTQNQQSDAEKDSRKQSPSPPHSLPAMPVSGSKGGRSGEPMGLGHSSTAPSAVSSNASSTSASAQSTSQDSGTLSLKNKLPSPISFLRFNRKSKKDRKSTDGNQAAQKQQEQQKQQQQQQYQQPFQKKGSSRPSSPAPPVGVASATADDVQLSLKQQRQTDRSPTSLEQRHGWGNDGDNMSDASSDNDSAKQGQQQQKPQHSNIPSIITPVRPPPTARLAGGNNRLPIHIERAIYRLASIKLANPRRPLLQQVLLSNMMFWYLELINPRSQQQQQQPQPQPQQQNMHGQAQPMQQQQQPQNGSPAAGPDHAKQQSMTRSGSPAPPRANHQHQHHQQQVGGDVESERRGGKRGGGSSAKNSRDSSKGRRASGGSNNGERVVMRSPQYERQQQQIYMSNGMPSQQHMQQQQQQQPYISNQAQSYSHSIQHEPDEDDDVPLALYRGERNAMSI